MGKSSEHVKSVPIRGHFSQAEERQDLHSFPRSVSSQAAQHCGQALHFLWSHFTPVIPNILSVTDASFKQDTSLLKGFQSFVT